MTLINIAVIINGFIVGWCIARKRNRQMPDTSTIRRRLADEGAIRRRTDIDELLR